MKRVTFISLTNIIFLLLTSLGMTTPIIPNRFISTDGNSNVIQFRFKLANLEFKSLADGWSFGIYDNDINSGLLLLEGGENAETEAKFEVYLNENNKWELKIIKGIDKEKTIDLGNSNSFSFFFKKDDNYYDPVDITEDGGIYYFWGPVGSGTFNSKGLIQGIDLQAVPLPSSTWLLITSIIGLFVINTKRNHHKLRGETK